MTRKFVSSKVVSNTRSIVVFRHIFQHLFPSVSLARNRDRRIPAVSSIKRHIKLKFTEYAQTNLPLCRARDKPIRRAWGINKLERSFKHRVVASSFHTQVNMSSAITSSYIGLNTRALWVYCLLVDTLCSLLRIANKNKMSLSTLRRGK